jgi:hypothetical protein
MLLVALAALPAPASAAGTASLQGSTIVFRGASGNDAAYVRYYPATQSAEASYVFGGLSGFKKYVKDLDDSVSAGDGCTKHSALELGVVYCPAAGVERVDVTLGTGYDYFAVGGRDLVGPASISVHGNAGNDALFADTMPPAGEIRLYGDEGDDGLSVTSRKVPVHMEGGPGNDRFDWEGTAPGVATFADGGPGDDIFRAEHAAGPDTIVADAGADYLNVRSGGDADTVECGPDGLGQLLANSTDHVAGCKLDAFSRTVLTLKPTVRRLQSAGASGNAIAVKGVQVPRAGVVRATLISDRNFKAIATARITARRGGPVALLLNFTRHGRGFLAQRPRSLRLVVTYDAPGGRLRGASIDARSVHTVLDFRPNGQPASVPTVAARSAGAADAADCKRIVTPGEWSRALGTSITVRYGENTHDCNWFHGRSRTPHGGLSAYPAVYRIWHRLYKGQATGRHLDSSGCLASDSKRTILKSFGHDFAWATDSKTHDICDGNFATEEHFVYVVHHHRLLLVRSEGKGATVAQLERVAHHAVRRF